MVVDPVAPQGPQLRAALLLQEAGGAKEELGAGQVRSEGQRGVLHEHTNHGGGPVAPQGPQLRAALLLQVAGEAKEELEEGQVQSGGQRGALHEHTHPSEAKEGFKDVKGEPGQHSRHGEPVLPNAGGEAGVGRKGCPQYGLEECEDSLQE